MHWFPKHGKSMDTFRAEVKALLAVDTKEDTEDTAEPVVTYPEKLTSGYYRVRKTWKDSKSQVGAYRILSNAKTAADKNPGTFVFANDGTAIYPVDETAEPDYRIHTVVKGDTLWEIAERYLGKGARYTEIKKLNGLTSNVIYSGSDGTTAFSYAEPKAIPGAVSISLDAEGETSPFYADGIVYFRSVTNNGYSGDLEIALIPEWFCTEILQEKLDAKGVLVENSGVGESVKFALLFEFDGDVNAIRHVLYNCSASRPSIESETKEDTIEPGTETLSITADPRSDGLVKARTGDTTDSGTYTNWYKAVYTPTGEELEEISGEDESV